MISIVSFTLDESRNINVKFQEGNLVITTTVSQQFRDDVLGTVRTVVDAMERNISCRAESGTLTIDFTQRTEFTSGKITMTFITQDVTTKYTVVNSWQILEQMQRIVKDMESNLAQNRE